MIQTRTRHRRQFRLIEEQLARRRQVGPARGLVTGGILGAMFWAMLAVALA